MKTIKICFLQCAVFLCGVQALSAQEKWIIRNHPLYPFSQYNGDTVKYLRQNFDGGAVDLYMGQPMSKFFSGYGFDFADSDVFSLLCCPS